MEYFNLVTSGRPPVGNIFINNFGFYDKWPHQAIFFWTLIVRHISRCLDKNSHPRPPPAPLPEEFASANYCQTSLSSAHAAQIAEIFNLFDTDGTGCIEQHEIGFALSALGFKSKEGTWKSQEEQDALDAIMGDGKVTLEEFIALMTGDIMSGDIGGYTLYEEARTAFSVLSRPDGDNANDGLITLNKLELVCQEFQVLLICLYAELFLAVTFLSADAAIIQYALSDVVVK